MSDCILIKGNKYGLTIILDENETFQKLKETLKIKIIDSKKFFKNAKVAITFTGKELSHKQQKELVDIITNYSDMEVTCILDSELSNVSNKNNSSQIHEQELLNLNYPISVFHNGTLRSGQQINVDHSIVIMGDVNPGANVIAKGNVIILGALKGNVYVKEIDGKYPFVVALSMAPMQLRIGDIMGRFPDKKEFTWDDSTAQIAYVEKGRICIETLNKNIYKELDFYNSEMIIN
jgi:septum site-determining protein MinC